MKEFRLKNLLFIEINKKKNKNKKKRTDEKAKFYQEIEKNKYHYLKTVISNLNLYLYP